MIKTAMNGLAGFIAEQDSKSHAYLRELGIIEEGFKRNDESIFLVSSPVDLENPLTAGLESAVFGRRSEGELRAYLDAPERNLNAAFKTYGLWRQIAGRREESA